MVKTKAVELPIKTLVGMRLLGFMPLRREFENKWEQESEYPYGDWDNCLALYLGTPENPEMYILRSQNQDYSMYDRWILEKPCIFIKRDDRYKTIGETIILVDNIGELLRDTDEWTEEERENYWLRIITKTKVLRFGHKWHDCHYPESIWEVISERGWPSGKAPVR